MNQQEKEIWEMEQKRRQAMIDNDMTALDLMVDDALMYTHSSGLKDNKATWLAAVKSGSLVYKAVDLREPTFIVNDNVALVSAVMHASVVRNGPPRDLISLYLAVWSRSATGWKLLAIQGTAPPVSK